MQEKLVRPTCSDAITIAADLLQYFAAVSMDAGITVTKTDAKFAVSTLFERILKFHSTKDFPRYIQFQFMVIFVSVFHQLMRQKIISLRKTQNG